MHLIKVDDVHPEATEARVTGGSDSLREIARKAGRDRATAADVERQAAPRRQAPPEELAYEEVLQSLNQCLHSLPRDIPWKDVLLHDELCRKIVKTLLQNILDRVSS